MDELPFIATSLENDLRTAGPRFSVAITPVPDVVDEGRRHAGAMGLEVPQPVDQAIQLSVDGHPEMWLVFFRDRALPEELADLLYQAQDVVMETTTEMWPGCPFHDHYLRPEPGAEWVAWTCPRSGDSIARFGQLGSQTV